ncbi:MAG: ACT domain-containing protein, partial [Planctomycetaceae bacterium]|nr:ACT domain-containing protein [Planctomycetaceae bacterium]
TPAPPADPIKIITRLQGMEDLAITDIALDESQVRVTVPNVPDEPGIAAQLFDGIAAGGVFVDMIVQSYGRGGKASLTFTVPDAERERALKVAGEISAQLGCAPITSSPKIAKLSVMGVGLRSHTDVAIRMFRALSAAGINVEMINTSEVRVNVVVDARHGKQAQAALQEAFQDVRV